MPEYQASHLRLSRRLPPDGTGDNCSDWTNGTSFGSLGTVGHNTATDSTWSEVFLQFCDRTISLYCVQQ